MTNIIMKTYDLVDEIKESALYNEYLDLKNRLSEYSDIINEFNVAKEKFENLEGGKYNPDFKEYSKKYLELKEALFNHEVIGLFLKKESEMQKYMDDISRKIASAISEEIKAPNELGIISGCKK